MKPHLKWISLVPGMSTFMDLEAWILNSEFWYGLRNINCLITRQQVDMQLLLTFSNGTSYLRTYRYFVVDRPERKYTLHIWQAEGPDSFDTLAFVNGILSPPMTMIMMPCRIQLCSAVSPRQWRWMVVQELQLLWSPHPQIYRNNYLDYVEMKVRPKLF